MVGTQGEISWKEALHAQGSVHTADGGHLAPLMLQVLVLGLLASGERFPPSTVSTWPCPTEQEASDPYRNSIGMRVLPQINSSIPSSVPGIGAEKANHGRSSQG